MKPKAPPVPKRARMPADWEIELMLQGEDVDLYEEGGRNAADNKDEVGDGIGEMTQLAEFA